MKTATTSDRRVTAGLLSVLCAGLFPLLLGGCAEGYYADTYYTSNYGYNGYYTSEYRFKTYYGPDYYPYYPWYSYYGGAYYSGY